MKKKFVLIALLTVFLLQPVYGLEETVFIYTVEYVYDNQGDTSYMLSEDDVTLPLSWDDEWQKVQIIYSSHPFLENKTDVDGNPVTVIEINMEIPPREKIEFNATYRIYSSNKQVEPVTIEQSGTIDSIPISLIEEYCSSTSTFNYKFLEVEDIASKLAGEKERVLEIVTGYVDWILTNLTYGNYDLPRYPNETLSTGVGDCDDQAILLISMLRSQNIPSYLQLGIVLNERIHNSRTAWDEHLKISQDGIGWHGWAVVFIPPWGWTPIDLTLTQKDSAIDVINDSPQYTSNVIPFINISEQEYIGDASETMVEIVNSSLYVVVNEIGYEVGEKSGHDGLLLLGTGIALVASIFLMIYLGRNN